MASVTFAPSGSQLDSDRIADIQLNTGDCKASRRHRSEVSFELDTSGLNANLQTLQLVATQDFAEVGLSAIRTDFDRTTFPDITLVDTSINDNFTDAVFERNGVPGAVPDTIILGNEAGIFYDDSNSFASGDADYAVISDLNIQEDTIELFGFARQYSLDFLPSSNGNIDAKLIYDSGIDSGTELIALLENVAPDLSVNGSAFTFV